MLDEVRATLSEQLQVFVEVDFGKGFSRGHVGSSSVHFEGTNGGDEDDSVGDETRDSALDVAELLHSNQKRRGCWSVDQREQATRDERDERDEPDISSKSSFRDDVTILVF